MIYKHIFQIIIHTKRSSWNLIFWGDLFNVIVRIWLFDRAKYGKN